MADAEVEVEAIRRSTRRDRPFGSDVWTRRTAEHLGLESSLRPPGRPKRAQADPPKIELETAQTVQAPE
jgi:hypothetical protein